MKLPKLVFDCRMILSSGVGRYQRELLPKLLTIWPTATLLGNPEELQYLNSLFPYTQIRSFPAPIYSIKEQFMFRKLIEECDLFWSPHYNTAMLPVRAKKRVVTIHDAFHLAQINALPIKQKIYAKWMMYKALENSDEIITVSEFSKNELLRCTSQKYDEKINVFYNGISDILYNPENRWPIYSGIPYFLFVGNVKPHKNLENAIIGYKNFLIRHPDLSDIKFVIVGKKNGFITGNNEQLQQLLCDEPILQNRIDFTGYVSDDDLGNLYASATALVFPSFYEGFGFPPLEAMKLSCPAIVARAACMPEICGEACLYVDPHDPGDIADKLYTIHEDKALRTTLIQKGLKQVQKYDWDTCARQHIKLFNNMIYA